MQEDRNRCNGSSNSLKQNNLQDGGQGCNSSAHVNAALGLVSYFSNTAPGYSQQTLIYRVIVCCPQWATTW